MITDLLLKRFLSRETDAVYLAYSSFVSMAVYRPTVVKFLNLDPAELFGGAKADAGAHAGGDLDYILEPSPEAVFESLLPRYLTSKIYITFRGGLHERAQRAHARHEQRNQKLR